MTERLVSFTLNGMPKRCRVEGRTTLLRALREMGTTSVKRGCEEGECGTCTVLVDGVPVKSCVMLAAEAEGKHITTSEGLMLPNGMAPNGHEAEGKLHPVQQAFLDEGAIQCGFCTPGMVLSTYALLKRCPDPTDEEIKEALSGNLCRCTGYVSIFRAVRKAAQTMKQNAKEVRS